MVNLSMEIQHKIYLMNQGSIMVVWIPSHVGLSDNEKADKSPEALPMTAVHSTPQIK